MAINWRPHFPHQEVRPQQEQAIEFALDAWQSGKRHVLLEAGTGVGKSAVAVCLARCLPELDNTKEEKAYFLTSQKVLQRQYVGSFKDMRSIWSSANFNCADLGTNCGTMIRVAEHLGTACESCPYKNARGEFLRSPLSVTNYSYFLATTLYGDGIIRTRDLLVMDEAHSIEDELTSWIGLRITKPFCVKYGLEFPDDCDTKEKIFSWMTKVLLPRVEAEVATLEKKLAGMQLNDVRLRRLAARYDEVDRVMCAIHRMSMMYYEFTWLDDRDAGMMHLRPISVASYAHRNLFKYGRRTLMMSATILNPDMWFRTVGLDPSEVAYLRLESPFPVENRPVFYAPVGKMSLRHVSKHLEVLAQRVVEILDKHPNEKGIIHTTSHRLAEDIDARVKDPRLIFQRRGDDIHATVSQHVNSGGPTVLVSPAMSEGVDLSDDLSRFQILVKVPYKNLGDPIVRARMRRVQGWYDCGAARGMVQAAGRSIRSEDDYAVTYILDACFMSFMRRSGTLFPQWFIDALQAYKR